MPAMNTQRLTSSNVKKSVPGLYPAASALSAAVSASGVDPELAELIYLRVSQINGCAYCIHMHNTKLREMGVSEAKRSLVVAWEEAGIFSEREEAAFRWAEAVTLLAVDHVPDETWAAVRAVFSEEEIVGLTTAVCAINVWNRLAVPFRYAPEL